LAKAIGGIAPEREIPRFATQTFRQSWARDGGAWAAATARDRPTELVSDAHRPGRVVLWVDTFTDHFHPDVARAAVDVLRDAGCDVVVPRAELCCGRPLYDWGFLAQARRLARTTLRELRTDIRAGVPVIGLEPSCVSVFRDEAPDLLHGDADARRLAHQMFTLTEYLGHLDGYTPPQVAGRALLHGHCHHKSVLDFDAEVRVLTSAGLELEVPDTGCCGMAGAFGFERGEHYRVSVAAGERVLLPAVRQADRETLVVTGGFSCREQIQQQTGRRVLHPAEVLARGLVRGASPTGTEGSIHACA
jgi:Fe-S oxidoreductase